MGWAERANLNSIWNKQRGYGMNWGELLYKLLKIMGNVITLGLYHWLKKRYGPKS